jgi:hypothetical protein
MPQEQEQEREQYQPQYQQEREPEQEQQRMSSTFQPQFQSQYQHRPQPPDFYLNERIPHDQPQFESEPEPEPEPAQSQEPLHKMQELKRLAYKHHPYPDVAIRLITKSSLNGDNTLLDEWLERYRDIDAASIGR